MMTVRLDLEKFQALSFKLLFQHVALQTEQSVHMAFGFPVQEQLEFSVFIRLSK